MKRSKVVLLVAVLGVLFTTLAISPVGAQRGPAEPPTAPGLPSLDELAAQAGADGTVSVIVGLDTPVQAEGRLDAAAVADQRGRIAQTRDQVLADVAGTSATVTQEYETLPFVAVEVDQAGLDALAASDAVKGIYDNTPVPPALDSSKPVIKAPQAYSLGFTGAGKTIAVLDTGVLKTHPFLSGKVVSEACYSADFDCPGGVNASTANNSGLPCNYSTAHCPHGTHVAGIAAGKTGVGGAPNGGVAKDSSIIAINVFSNVAAGAAGSYPSDQIKGLERVFQLRNSFDIASVNMSLGGGQFTTFCDGPLAPTKAAIDQLRSVGIATVIATGNDGFTTSIGAPACISTAISVGSTTDADAISSFSNQSFQVNLVAPGSSITSSVCTGGACTGSGYDTYNGTSMATPHVAAAFAILDQKAGRDTVGRKMALLHETGTVVTDITGLKFSRINLQAALNNMPATPPNPGFTDVPPSHAFYPDIAWGANEDIIGGYPDDTFRPNNTLNRDAMVAYLYRLEGEPLGPFPDPGFSDVSPGDTFYTEIAWAVHNDVAGGFPDGTFRPGDPVTRSAMAAFLWRMQNEPTSPIPNPGTLPNPGFTDVGTGHAFKNPIFWAAYQEITQGYSDGTFRPGTPMKRQEAAAFLYRFAPLLVRAP
jgi:subtilisin family serine protease